MSLDRVVFPTKPANPVRKLWAAAEHFHTHHHMLAWFCWVGFGGAVLALSAVVKP